jgi:2-polyprenyl-6-methoxyphenol hydroxylase-like FAD-dependent oxidoreductase
VTDVLIIGAGPTGLMMACQLAIHNISFRIIDKNEDHTTQSRAIVIHAASMEIFAQMGIADQFLELGKQVRAINYVAKNKVIHIPLFSAFGKDLTEFPFFLALEQSKTEKLLIDFLEKRGHSVERNVELVSLTQSEESVTAVLNHKDGKEETMITRWLVGADGAKSVVRHQLEIPFSGETYPLDLFVLDCRINWPFKDDELSLAFSDTSFAGFFPLPEGRCRVISFVPKEFTGKPHIEFEDINTGFAERMQMDIKLYDPNWISTYRAHHRYVSEFKKGRCFLAGDAAHVHSPVGAQGMNTGLHDAYNLAWKLALVIKGRAKDILLSSYQDERLPFARQLVKTTDRAFGVTVSNNAIVRMMRMYVAPYILSGITKIRWLAKFMFRTVSQIGISYSDSVLTHDASKGIFQSKAPRPGERLPFFVFEDEFGSPVNIQRFIGDRLHLLLFTQSNAEVANFENLIRQYPDISLTQIPYTHKSAKLFDAFGIRNNGYYFVRPDLYIAYRGSSLEAEHLQEFLDAFIDRN